MARASGNSSTGLIAVLVGALAVAVLVIGWLVYSGSRIAPPVRPPVGIDLSLPKAPLPEGPKMPDAPIPRPR